METIEVTASSLAEAVEKAAQTLGVGVEDVKTTVLEESKGLFGRGQVRVRAEVAQPKARRTRTSAQSEEPPPSAESAVEEGSPKTRRAARTAKASEHEGGPAVPSNADEALADDAESEGEDVEATSEDADALAAILEELLESSGLRVRVGIGEVHGKYVDLELEGLDTSYLIGRRGEVLNALQYYMNVVSARQLGRGVRVVVDGDDYRARRAEVLTRRAHDIAEQVIERGEEAVLEALPAFERRVIHQALGEIAGVVTYSEGEEPNRRVVIAPAD